MAKIHNLDVPFSFFYSPSQLRDGKFMFFLARSLPFRLKTLVAILMEPAKKVKSVKNSSAVVEVLAPCLPSDDEEDFLKIIRHLLGALQGKLNENVSIFRFFVSIL